MRNLQEIIPAFFVGPGGARLTPEQIAARQQIAQSLREKATDTSPNAGGWASILSKGAMGLASGMQEGRAERAAQANADADQRTSQALLASLTGTATPSGGWTGMAPTADVAAPPSVASALMKSPQMAPNQLPVPALQAGQMPSILPQSFLAAVDRTEGAGGYDTLFGHAQRGAFKGTDISRMPIRDVIAFTDPSGPYAQSVKAQVGSVATPVGRYQIVGTTLRNAIGALGLDPNQPFDAATQDRVAAYLATNRIRSASDLPSQISALRNEWKGFRNVPDDQMAQIIADLQNVDPMAAQRGAATSANIPMGGAAQEVAAPGYVDPMVSAPNSRVPPTPSVNVAQSLTPPQRIGTNYFPPAPRPGGLDPAVIQALSDPSVSPQNKQIATMLVQQYQGRRQAEQEQAMAEAARRQEIQQRQQFLAANNLDPSIAGIDAAWAEAVKTPFRGPQPLQNLGDGTLYDPNAPQGQRFIKDPNRQPSTPDSVRALEIRAERAGLRPETPEYKQFMITEGKGAGIQFRAGPDGTFEFSENGTLKPFTEAQSKDNVFMTRAQNAMPLIDAFEQKLLNFGESAAGILPGGMGNYLQSEEYQLARDAGREFLATILRKDTGAAVTPSEEAMYGDMFLPRPGDKPKTVAAKRQRRALAAEAIGAGMSVTQLERVARAIQSVETSTDAAGVGGPEVPPPAQEGPDGWTDIGGVKIRPKGGN
jgi:muramidase (phage lysozyme)